MIHVALLMSLSASSPDWNHGATFRQRTVVRAPGYAFRQRTVVRGVGVGAVGAVGACYAPPVAVQYQPVVVQQPVIQYQPVVQQPIVGDPGCYAQQPIIGSPGCYGGGCYGAGASTGCGNGYRVAAPY